MGFCRLLTFTQEKIHIQFLDFFFSFQRHRGVTSIYTSYSQRQLDFPDSNYPNTSLYLPWPSIGYCHGWHFSSMFWFPPCLNLLHQDYLNLQEEWEGKWNCPRLLLDNKVAVGFLTFTQNTIPSSKKSHTQLIVKTALLRSPSPNTFSAAQIPSRLITLQQEHIYQTTMVKTLKQDEAGGHCKKNECCSQVAGKPTLSCGPCEQNNAGTRHLWLNFCVMAQLKQGNKHLNSWTSGDLP